MRLTEQQQLAVDAKGTVLVSAAAGSGKTAVLTQRVLRKVFDEENPVDIDRLLIITFTNAAAREMKERISASLSEYINENPDDKRAKKQQMLMDSAQITTIDSFCINLAKDNFDALNINPEFKIATEEQISLMSDDALDMVISSFYKEKASELIELFDIVDPNYGEQKLKELILNIYRYSRSLAFPNEWFEYSVALYNEKSTVGDTLWGQILFDDLFDNADNMLMQLENTLQNIKCDQKVYDAYIENVSLLINAVKNIRNYANDRNYECVRGQAVGLSMPRLGVPKKEHDALVKESAKAVIDRAKTFIKNTAKLFDIEEQLALNDVSGLKKYIKLIFDMVKQFGDALDKLKEEKNCLDFADVEYSVLDLLLENRDGKRVKSNKVVELSNQYDEIMIDEYQDTNDLQNKIFSCISNDEQNLFYVGDVKQCIYKFRNANPDNFIEKKNNYPIYNGNHQKSKISLSGNFRSRPEICNFINFVFSLLMTEKTVGFNYGDEDMLVPMGDFQPTEYEKVEVNVVTGEDIDDEANAVAQYIKNAVDGGMLVSDKAGLRKCNYGDFMILMRNRTNQHRFVEALKRKHIPVWAEIKGGFFESPEIKLALSLLKVIDNPLKDVPLLSVMMSEIFNFTADEVAQIRFDSKKKRLYESVVVHSKDSKKCALMLKVLEKYRLWASSMPTDKLILKLYSDTALLAICGAKPDGYSKQANLQLLCQYAADYENQGYKGLNDFIRYIDSVERKGTKLSRASYSNTDNAVRVATIHYSKGLQTPVCILAACETNFESRSLSDTVMNEKLGIGIRYCDVKKDVRYDTLQRKAIAKAEKKTALAEEMRLMYVAMSRAVDKLLIVALDKQLEKHILNISSLVAQENCSVDDSIDFVTVNGAKSMYEWLIMCLTLHPDAKMIKDICPFNYNTKQTESHVTIKAVEIEEHQDEVLHSDITNEHYDFEKSLSYQYPYSNILNVQSKYSPSKIGEHQYDEGHSFLSVPAFVTDSELNYAQKGSAMHKFMQYANFEDAEKNAQAEADRIETLGVLSKAERQSLDFNKIKMFFKSELYARIKSADRVIKECHFMVEMPINEIDKNIDSDEKVVIDGTADLVIFEDGEISVIDFKTDRVDDQKILVERHSRQLELYATAFSNVYSTPVKQCVIYSFELNRGIII